MQAIRRLFGDQASEAIELPEWVGPSGGLASAILRGLDPSAPMTQSWFPASGGDVAKAIRVPSGDTDAGPALSMSLRGAAPSRDSFQRLGVGGIPSIRITSKCVPSGNQVLG